MIAPLDPQIPATGPRRRMGRAPFSFDRLRRPRAEFCAAVTQRDV